MGETKIYWIDLFCGGGGTTTGIHLVGRSTEVLACVNHDKNAIESHKANHPNALHFTEDIRDFKVIEKLRILVENLRAKEPSCIINLWASLECTNHSRAKGGLPKNADSRSLANHMDGYIKAISPDYFYVENVTEFLIWGPLDEKGKPIPDKKGIDYHKWEERIKSFGYNVDKKKLNAADFGSYQSRERLFVIFSKHDIPIFWPEQTYSKDGSDNDLFGYKKWNSVKEILELEDYGKSIFNRKKPLVDKTLEVIYKGIVKALKEEENVFLYKYYGNGINYNSVNSPAGTVTTKDRFAKIQLIFNQYKTGFCSSINEPSKTVTTTPKQNLLTFMFNPAYGGHSTSINRPSPTVIARQDKAPLYLINALMSEHGISDIYMRMLKIPELKQIQGFPKDYILRGTQAEQKKYIGNAVDVNMSKALAAANTHGIIKHFKSKKIA